MTTRRSSCSSGSSASAYGMSSLIATITVLMELKPF